MDIITFFVYYSHIQAQAVRGAPIPSLTIQLVCCHHLKLASWNHQNLCAPFWRFYWNPFPGGSIEFAGKKTGLTPGQCMAIPPNTPFSSYSRGQIEQFYLHFLAAAPYDTTPPAVYLFPLTCDLQAAIEQAGNLVKAGAAQNHPRLSVLGTFLATYALCRVPEAALGPAHSDPRITSAIHEIEENYAGETGNLRLAKNARMNTNAFIRLFKEETGVTPQAYVLRKRIEKGCVMLHTTEMSIDEIAGTTGFCDRYHFSKVFKKQLNIGPAAFRKAGI